MKRWIGVAIALGLGSCLAVEGLPNFAGNKRDRKAAIASLQPSPIDRIWEKVEKARQLAAANRREAAIAQLNEAITAARSLGNTEERNPLIVKIIAEYGEIAAFEEAIAQLSTFSYDEPLPGGDYSLRMRGEVIITEALVRAKALDRALEFARSISFEPSKSRALVEVVSGYAIAGQLETAAAIVQTLQDDSYQQYRAINALMEGYRQWNKYVEGLAFLDRLSGENKESAARSLAEAAWRSGRYNIALQSIQKGENTFSKVQNLRELSKALVSVGQIEQAAILVAQAFELSQQTDEHLPFGWVEDFLVTGQEERANAIIATLKRDRNEAASDRALIAHAYLKVGRVREAFEVAQKIPDRVLLPLPEYRDPKVELFEAIIERALKENQFEFAVEIASSLTEKTDRVAALQIIARQHSNPEQALNLLDRALDIAQTIELISVVPERHLFWIEPNSNILLSLAQDYLKFDQKPKVLEILQQATRSIQKFETQYSFDQPVWTKSNALSRVALFYQELGEIEKAAEILALVTAEIPKIEGLYARIREQIAVAKLYVSLNKNSEAIALTEAAEQQIQSFDRPVTQFSSLFQIVTLWIQLDRAERAARLLDRILIASEQLEEKDDKISTWIGAIAAYRQIGKNDLARNLTSKTLQEILTLHPRYEKTKWFKALGRACAIPDSAQLALEIVRQVPNSADKARILLATATEYANQNKMAVASELLERALAISNTISDREQRNKLLIEFSQDLNLFQLLSLDMLSEETWRYSWGLPIAESIDNPELRVQLLLQIAFKFWKVDDEKAARRSFDAAIATDGEQEMRQTRLSKMLEIFDLALTAEELKFAYQIAKNIEDSGVKIVALRQVARKAAISGNLEQARTLLDEAIQTANTLENEPYRQQVLADIRQQQLRINERTSLN